MSRLLVSVLLLLVACKSSTGPSDPFETDEFNATSLSSYARYTDGGVDPWVVGNGVLSGAGPSMQSVLVRTGKSVDNGWVETAVSEADDGGLVVRFLNNENYLLLAIRDDSSMGGSWFSGDFRDKNLEIYQRSGPGQDGFVSVWQHDLTWPRGQQKVIRFAVSGDTLKVLVDGTLMGTVQVPVIHAGSGFGLRHQGTHPNWVSRYEWLRWSR